MNLRFTFFVVLVALALVALVLTMRDTESRQVGPGAPTATLEPILSLDENDVQEVAVVAPTGAYTLSRVAGGWEVDDRPAGTEVSSVVATLARPAVLRLLPEDRKPEDYGFASPSLTVTLRTAAGDSHVIVVGDKAVAEERRYVRLSADGPIAMVSNYDFQRLIDWLADPPLAPTPTPTGDTPTATGTQPQEGTAEPDDDEAAEPDDDEAAEPPGASDTPTPTETPEATRRPAATRAPTTAGATAPAGATP